MVALGIFCGWIADNSAAIVDGICGVGTKPSWCLPIRMVFLKFGWNGLAYFLITLGSVLAIFYNFVSEIIGEILSMALNHVATSSRVVLRAMEQNKLSRQESSEIIVETIARYMGYYDKYGHSFADFLNKRFVKQVQADGGFWRRDYSAIINVEKLNANSTLDPENYLLWRELVRFTVGKEGAGGTYKYSSQSIIEISDELATDETLTSLLNSLRYDVRVGGDRTFSFETLKPNFDLVKIRSEDGFLQNGMAISFRDGNLKIALNLDVPITDPDVDIVVDEQSYIAIDDTTYQLSFVEPTKGLTFRFNLPEGFKLVHEGISGTRYGTSRPADIELTRETDKNVRVDASSWNLPGIITILVWKRTD
jgi:hypothetical protein